MFHENTKVREIMHLPGILPLVEKYTGKRLGMSTLKLGANLTLQRIGSHLHWTRQQLQEVIAELNMLAEKHSSGTVRR